eukprot:1500402-Rhodomonas_salina.1
MVLLPHGASCSPQRHPAHASPAWDTWCHQSISMAKMNRDYAQPWHSSSWCACTSLSSQPQGRGLHEQNLLKPEV